MAFVDPETILEQVIIKRKISTDKAPAAIGPYSQAVVSNGMLYTSGQIPLDPATGNMVEGGIEEQMSAVGAGGASYRVELLYFT